MVEIQYYITRLSDGFSWGWEPKYDQPLDYYNDSKDHKVEEL